MTVHHVHLVEDDRDVAGAVGFLLRTMGYEVATYGSGVDFLQKLPELAEGCVITDVDMPGMSGIELAAQLRSLDIPMPVIVISGNGDSNLSRLAQRVGAAQFIAKPFDDDILLEALQRL